MGHNNNVVYPHTATVQGVPYEDRLMYNRLGLEKVLRGLFGRKYMYTTSCCCSNAGLGPATGQSATNIVTQSGCSNTARRSR